MRRSILIVGVLLLSLVSTLACQQGGIKDNVQTPFQPKKDIENNELGKMMWLAPTSDAVSIMQKAAGLDAFKSTSEADNYFVIRKNILEKDLLFVPTVVNSPVMEDEKKPLPIFLPELLGPKIVYFKAIGNKIYLFENLEGKDISQPYEHEGLIAEFSVMGEDRETITFDFKSGFNRLIVVGNHPADIGASYVRDYKTRSESFFAVYHVAQIRSWEDIGTTTFSYAFMPAESRLTRIAPDTQHKVNFIKTEPIYEKVTGEQTASIARIDISKPFVFYLSSNTPAEYRDSIKEGVLAWNNVFGKEVLEVLDAPEGLLAGDPFSNVIQWVESDAMEFAYSNSSLHPITGEVIRSNIIFPSRWVVNGKRDAEALLKRFKGEEQAGIVDKKGKDDIGLSGFDRQEQCRLSTDSSWLKFLSKVANGEVVDEEALELSKMFIRAVAMHEVGHTIGLKHNFAGNLGSEIATSDENAQLDSFLNTLTSSKLPSSSIMDYLPFEDDIRMHSPGTYDRAAIRWGYFASKGVQDDMEFPIFCSDKDTIVDADCTKHDSGREPIHWRIEKLREDLEEIWMRIKSGEEKVYSNFPDHINGLLNYLNGRMTVHDMTWGDQLKRRTEVVEAVDSYLKPSDADYGAIASLAAIMNKGTLDGLSDDERKRIFELAYNVRKVILQRALSGLATREAEIGNDGNKKNEGFSLYEDEKITTPISGVAADIVANHLEIGLSAEPFESRQLAANLLISYNYEPFLEAKKYAIDKLNEEISLIQEAAKSAIGEQAEKLQTALGEEQTLVSTLESAGQR